MKPIVVIPAYNEEKTIATVVKNIKKYCDVVVVNDASKDETATLAKEAGATVITNDKNLGYDGTLNRGIKHAVSLGADIILLMDADGQHNSEDIPKMLKPIEQEKADFVIGIRPWKARISEKIYAKYSEFKIGVSDPLCGFKAFRSEIFSKVGYYDSIGSVGTEFMFAAKKHGYKIAEVPITLNERADMPRFGDGIKLNAEWKIFSAMLKVMVKYL
ncbi:MAG: glycosyltransferase family 2 protein [Candidatus Micrarchaeota archaeon]